MDKNNQLRTFKIASLILFIFVLFLLVIISSFFIFSSWKKIQSGEESKIAITNAKPSKTISINKTIEYPIDKTSLEKFKLFVDKAQIVKAISSNNKIISAKKDEEYVLINLEIQNDLTIPIAINSINYFRLISQGKKLAPDFFNGQIIIQPISTGKDKIGFIVKSEIKQIKLQVGQIEGEKEILEINL